MQAAIAIAVVVGALVTSAVIRRTRRVDVPTQPTYQLPVQLDRADFQQPSTPWLVVVFWSSTCTTCADVVRKSAVLASRDVVVHNVDYSTDRHLHDKYTIDAVPIVAIADHAGVVRAGFIGPVSATDLWAAVAEARQPGASPEPGLGR